MLTQGTHACPPLPPYRVGRDTAQRQGCGIGRVGRRRVASKQINSHKIDFKNLLAVNYSILGYYLFKYNTIYPYHVYFKTMIFADLCYVRINNLLIY